MFFIISVFVCESFLSSAQKIVINEVMSSNALTIADEDGDYSDWIEIYNAGSGIIDLEGFFISDDTNVIKKWRFPDTSISAGSFLILFASGKDKDSGNYLHTNFRLELNKEPVVLSDTNGNVIDIVRPFNLAQDRSFGRKPDGTDSFYTFDICSPGSSNMENGKFHQLEYSHSAGFYEEPFNMHITSEIENDTIYYTLNGRIPDSRSFKYDTTVFIENRSFIENIFSSIPTNPDNSFHYWKEPEKKLFKATTIRAAAFKNGIRQSEIETRTYFVSGDIISRYTFPVISLVTDSNNFFNYDFGIYIPGVYYDMNPGGWYQGNYFQKGDDWERPVHAELFSTNGDLLLSRDCGIRTHGEGSKLMPQKSLRLYADEKYGDPYFNYRFFPDIKTDHFKTIILRNSGHDNPATMFADCLMHYLVRNTGLEIQHSVPAIVFINGEYWGIHNIRERIDKYYLAKFHNLPVDEIDLLEFKKKIIVIEGDSNHYTSMINFLKSNSAVDNSNYEYIKTQMDIDNFIDYQIVKIFYAVNDWPANNVKLWRPNSPEGRWRWILFDNDDGFKNYDSNTVEHALKEKGPAWPNPEWVTFLFRDLIKNEEFKKNFLSRFTYFLNTVFRTDSLLKVIDDFKMQYSQEIEEHISRWGWPVNIDQWNSNVEVFVEFAYKRPCIITEYLRKEFGIEDFGIGCPSEVNSDKWFVLYPNPNKGYFNIYCKSGFGSGGYLEITDVTGKVIQNEQIEFSSYTDHVGVNVNGIKPGIYFTKVTSGGISETMKMIVYH